MVVRLGFMILPGVLRKDVESCDLPQGRVCRGVLEWDGAVVKCQ